MLKKIYHNRNELQEVEFFEDKECTQAFDFANAKNLYIELKDADIMPLCYLHYLIMDIPHSFVRNDVLPNKPSLGNTINIYTPYIPSFFDTRPRKANLGCVKTLNDITPNLSKYIPEDNAVLFLSEEDKSKYYGTFKTGITVKECIDGIKWDLISKDKIKKLTIFLPHGTQSELQKASEVVKELMEKYGAEEVNLCALHCLCKYIDDYNSSFLDDFYKQNYNDAYNELCSMECKPDMTKNEYKKQFEIEKKNHKRECYINKIITTNSTGVLKPEDSKERLQVIDCFDIFQDHLNNI